MSLSELAGIRSINSALPEISIKYFRAALIRVLSFYTEM